MYQDHRLEIAGYEGRPVPNTFFRQRDKITQLAILLPGYTYTTDMPLLYYPTMLFLENAFDVFHVQYAYQKEPSFRVPVKTEERQRLSADVRIAVYQGLAQRAYREIVVLGMSLGTLAMGQLLAESVLPPATKWVWLSPLFRDAWLGKQILQHTPHSLFVVGTADPHHDSPIRQQVHGAIAHEWLLVEGARHDLEIGADIRRTLQVVEHVVCAIARFTGCSDCD